MSTQELSNAVLAARISSYVSVGCSVVVFYDHLVLLPQEIRLIWSSKPSMWRTLFLLNRYVVPPCFIWMVYQLSNLSLASYSTLVSSIGQVAQRHQVIYRILIAVAALQQPAAFVFHRVYTIWNKRQFILIILVTSYACTYIGTVVLSIIAVVRFIIPDVSLDIQVACAAHGRSPFLVGAYSLPVILDLILLILTCWNALDRPIVTEHSTVMIGLVRDGIVYFAISLSLRLFNIVVFTRLGPEYINLSWPALWAIITAVVNRMILFGTNELREVQQQGFDPKGRLLGQLDLPFLLQNGIGSHTYLEPEDSSQGHSDSPTGTDIPLHSFLPKLEVSSRMSWF
ncbi:hypothetical protein M422DRAFT_256092 [Sphaerobolus stellatus SS14]|uniref:DUF6533 domain-containing protein n=1 Tax=Sphaerobolus stellatus (strain SS14) TaxID=990650 RepID=A0A0C9UCU9_SPHS4|nr:hypothetical protein M422DRAFT_256092 [Sphaerobolus stellatus SS14]